MWISRGLERIYFLRRSFCRVSSLFILSLYSGYPANALVMAACFVIVVIIVVL